MKRKPPTRLQNRLAWRRKAKRFVARGLTTRGTVRKLHRWTELDLHGPARKLERDRRRYHKLRLAGARWQMDFLLQNFRAKGAR